MENKKVIQYVDIEVTKKKFKEEVKEFRLLEEEYKKLGVLCTKIEDFSIYFLFAVPHIKPQPIAFSVVMDYSNWDCEPPSLKIIDTFSEKILSLREVSIQFLNWNFEENKPQQILVGDERPFFCIRGVKEYHQHPYHSGDSWMLHRTRGEGKLCDLVEKLLKYSISLAIGFLMNVNGVLFPFNNLPLASDINKIIK